MLFLNEDTDLNVITEETDGCADILIADALLTHLSEAELREFLESSECEALIESKMLRRNTIVRLNKKDDFTRRSRLAALQVGRNKKDPLVKLLSKIIKQKKAVMDKLHQKYKSQGDREAKVAQKEYYKKVPALKLRIPGVDSTNFKKA